MNKDGGSIGQSWLSSPEFHSLHRRCASAVRGCFGISLWTVVFGAITLAPLTLIPEPVYASARTFSATSFVKDVWQSEQGLPQDSVSTILRTRDGYLWLGTNGGLVRFDGVHFTVFEPGETPGLAGNRITALFEDRDGALWIGSESGLTVFKDGQFKSFTKANGLSDNTVRSICQDRDGALWIGLNGGVSRLAGDRFESVTFNGKAPIDVPAFTYADRDGGLWLSTEGTVYRFADGVLSQELVGVDQVVSMYSATNGDVWIGTNTGLRRLSRGAWKTYDTRTGLPSDAVLALTEDHDGDIWIGTESGLSVLRDGHFRTFTTEDGLSRNNVRAVLEDNEHDLWIGTDGGGLNRWKPARVDTLAGTVGLPTSSVVPILQDREGTIWIGATCGGLIRFKDGVAKTYTKRDGLLDDCVWSLAEDNSGGLWVGTFGQGLFHFSEGHFAKFSSDEDLPGNIVFSLYRDSVGSLWIGTNDGLARFKDGKLTTYRTEDGLVNNSVRYIMEDRSNAIWLATAGGISRFKDGVFTNYTTRDGLSYDSVRAIYEDRDGVLWIGTYGGGLDRFKDGKFVTYTTKEGLLDKTVSRIIEDSHGNLWLNGNSGISRVRKKELNDYAEGKRKSVSAVTYGVADGMRSREGAGGGQPAGWMTQNGKIWFPTIAGVAIVDPNESRGDAPPVLIEDMVVNNNPVRLGGTLQIPPGASEIEFHYTALSFENPARVRFKYRLDGYDKDWVDAGSRRTAYYTNLAPGSYGFEVVASNSEGVWNDKGAFAEFRLRPHFYQTFVFYLFSAIVIVGGAWGLYRIRVLKLETRASQLSLLVEQRSQAEEALRESNRRLEDALEKLSKAQLQIIQQERLRALGQMASGVAHDFNNALAPILGFSELLLLQPEILGDRERVAKDVRIINTAAKDAASVVRGLREFYRQRADGEVSMPVRLDEIIAQAISLTQPRWRNEAQAKGITINVSTDLQSVSRIAGNEAELRDVLINLIFNSVDAMPTGGTISFSTRTDGDWVTLEASDTGTGMNEEVRQRCFEPFFTTKGEQGTGLGLARVYGTIKRHGGTIEIDSQAGVGTSFTIRLPAFSQPADAEEEKPSQAIARSLHALVVDDEPQVRQLIVEYLGVDGHTAETAGNGREGLEKFREGRFDLVITDMAMPEMNGDQLAEIIKRIASGVPVILLTGFGEIMNSTGENPSGVSMVLGKPVGMKAFRNAVATAMVQSKQGSGPPGSSP